LFHNGKGRSTQQRAKAQGQFDRFDKPSKKSHLFCRPVVPADFNGLPLPDKALPALRSPKFSEMSAFNTQRLVPRLALTVMYN
jgi:hypothetical protein